MAFRRSTDTELPKYGPGPDFPREVGRTESTEPDTDYGRFFEYLEPKPIVNANYKVKYPYNKVTKYLAGHRIELNSTPGNEYVNIEHGDETCRMTMMNGGTMEIRQVVSGGQGPTSGTGSAPTRAGGGPGQGPSYLHKLEGGTHQREVVDGNTVDLCVDGLHLDRAKQQFLVGESLVNIRSQKGPVFIRAQAASNNTSGEIPPAQNQNITLVGKKIINDGDVVINGDLVVFGNLKFAGDVDTVPMPVKYTEESSDGRFRAETLDDINFDQMNQTKSDQLKAIIPNLVPPTTNQTTTSILQG